jgi:hypothetical protein
MPDKKDDDSMCRISISTDSSDFDIDLEQLHAEKEAADRQQSSTTYSNFLTPIKPNPDGVATYLKYENPWPNRKLSKRSHQDADLFNVDEKLVSKLIDYFT